MKDVSIMLKPASSACNMRCKYCFYHDVASERDIASFGAMSEDVACAVIDSAFELADGGSVYFAFQGGEPLLRGKDFFRFFFDRVNNSKGKSAVSLSMQTNGTLIDEEWAQLFKQNDVLVGLSLDGDRNDNSFRMYADFSPAFNDIMRAAELLKGAGVDFNILSVVTGRLADNIERVYAFFKKCGFKFLQFIPCLRPFAGAEGELYMTQAQYARFLITLFNLYVKDFMRGEYVSIRRFDNWVRLYLGERCEECGVGGFCSHQFVVEGNGNVYPCDFYCLDDLLLGNITQKSFSEMARSKKAEDFIRSSLFMPQKCRTCPYFFLCRGGGCKRARSYDYCAAYKAFFSACLPLFALFKTPKA